jgi:hypothetical protein
MTQNNALVAAGIDGNKTMNENHFAKIAGLTSGAPITAAAYRHIFFTPQKHSGHS